MARVPSPSVPIVPAVNRPPSIVAVPSATTIPLLNVPSMIDAVPPSTPIAEYVPLEMLAVPPATYRAYLPAAVAIAPVPTKVAEPDAIPIAYSSSLSPSVIVLPPRSSVIDFAMSCFAASVMSRSTAIVSPSCAAS